MEIKLNGQATQIDATYSVAQLISECYEGSGKGIAVAINQCVIPKSDWPVRKLSPNDHITIIAATQGG